MSDELIATARQGACAPTRAPLLLVGQQRHPKRRTCLQQRMDDALMRPPRAQIWSHRADGQSRRVVQTCRHVHSVALTWTGPQTDRERRRYRDAAHAAREQTAGADHERRVGADRGQRAAGGSTRSTPTHGLIRSAAHLDRPDWAAFEWANPPPAYLLHPGRQVLAMVRSRRRPQHALERACILFVGANAHISAYMPCLLSTSLLRCYPLLSTLAFTRV